MLCMSVKLFSLTPGAPSHLFPLRHHGPELNSPHRAALSLSALFKPSPDRRKRMTDNLCPICSDSTWARTSYRETHRTEATEDKPLWGKTGLRASPESASGCP